MFFYFLVDKFSFMAEIIILEWLLCRYSEKRSKFPLRVSLVASFLLAAGCLITQYMVHAFPYGAFVSYFTMYILSVAGIFVCYKVGVWGGVFVSVSAYALQNVTYNLFRILKLFLMKDAPKVVPYIVHLTLFVALFVIIWFVTKNSKSLIENADGKSKTNRFLLLAGVVLIFTVTFIDTRGMGYIMRGDKRMARVFLQVCIIIIGLLVVMLQFCALREKKGKIELDRIKQILHEQKKVYLDNKELFESINIRFHDLKHQLLYDGDNMTEERRKQISETIAVIGLLFDTGNKALDTVLKEKGFRCAKEKITLTCMVDGNNLRFMSESDIYSLFGNAIDNAMAAVSKLPEEKRFISITENKKGNLLDISIENCYDGKVDFEDGLPKSKRDLRYHGFGVKSMKMIAEKYGGRLSVCVNDDLFRVDIFLPIHPLPDKNAN